jgi:oligoendopeptidase F
MKNRLIYWLANFIYINKNFMMIRFWSNKFFYFWFDNRWQKITNRGRPKKYQHKRWSVDNKNIQWTFDETTALKYLSDGLNDIINKTKDTGTPQQKSLLSGYRTLMNQIINYHNSEWRGENKYVV